jgi:hypothetical protein
VRAEVLSAVALCWQGFQATMFWKKLKILRAEKGKKSGAIQKFNFFSTYKMERRGIQHVRYMRYLTNMIENIFKNFLNFF